MSLKDMNREQKREAFQELIKSKGGQLLLVWLNDNVKASRESAGKLEPVPAWGKLQFADGLQSVIHHIEVMAEESRQANINTSTPGTGRTD